MTGLKELGWVRLSTAAALAITLHGTAEAQPFNPGDRVEASPFSLSSSWEACVVVRRVNSSAYELECSGGTHYVVGNAWIRAGAAAPAAGANRGTAGIAPRAADGARNAAAGAPWRRGMTVLGSPSHIPGGFSRCQVMGGPNASGYYDLDCAQWYRDQNGVKRRYMKRNLVAASWIKANDPAFERDMQIGAVRAQSAGGRNPAPAEPAPRSAAGDGGPVPLGNYQCFGGSAAGNMKLSFRSRTTYANEQGTVGTFSQSGPTIAFKTGPWAGFYGHVFANGHVQLSTAPGRASTMTCQRL